MADEGSFLSKWEKVIRETPRMNGASETNLFARRDAPDRRAYRAIAAWFEDDTATEMFLLDMSKAGFKIVPVDDEPA